MRINIFAVVIASSLLVPCAAAAQQTADPPSGSSDIAAVVAPDPQNVPPSVQQAQSSVERTVRRFRIGAEGGVGLDPELIQFGAHGSFGPLFNRSVEFRPGIEFGIGEVTTLFGINLDVLYTLPGATAQTRWTPYIGAGPNFALSHRGFEATGDGTTATVVTGASSTTTESVSRFDFSDTSFNTGFNFIAGARNASGLFFEMKATAWGVSNVRLLAGFNF